MESAKKKILIITYYWPPSGGAGVQRWLKISKYLAENHVCYVYTPENPDFALTDDSLLTKVNPKIKVIKRKIFEPYFIYRAFLKKKDRATVNQPSSVDKGGGVVKKIAKWLRGNIFIPDPRRFWINPSARYLKNIIEEEKIDVVISTGPPHSMHLIAYKLKKRFGKQINWIADFRDPWTNIDFYDMLQIGKRADQKNRKLENNVITSCDTLVSVSSNWGKDFEALGAKNVKIITNGFDPDDYTHTSLKEEDKFILTHLGSINADRNPNVLWRAIKELKEEDAEFNQMCLIRLIGTVHSSVRESVQDFNLELNVEFVENKPHREAIGSLSNSHISLLLLNNAKNIDGIIPGKLFEYIGVGNPIFAIGKKEGDSGMIIKNNKLGVIADFEDISLVKSTLVSFFEKFKNKSLENLPKRELDKFSIERICESFEEIF